ncbi:outer membrane protein beta-barrel domain protein [Halobacteriovorax sp. BALOs_7]|uniref:hypothetical protein n=1 Tax=Halobacteriovorax sp. BALOs_7 TaxID=2109558 RepID=UPI000EA3F9EA|nr:hypothetical protein [Halobacteriovorax sp. BALOs_7]AYF45288.1 outer membrane protein beta-barrel domain protein [Halobacteriovorax sp. BALOs_7]
MQVFKRFLIFLLIISGITISAKPYEYYLRTGLTLEKMLFNELDDDQFENRYDIEDRDESTAFGIYTQFSYRYERVEIGIESHTTFGRAKDLQFGYEGNILSGSGNFRSFTITPTLRFNTPDLEIEYLNFIGFRKFKAYVKFGPSWQLSSLSLDGFNIDSNDRDLKLNYDSFGGALAVGIEQIKEIGHYPFFLEVSVAGHRSYKVTLIDRTDPTKVEIVKESSARNDINSFSIFYKVGVTLF